MASRPWQMLTIIGHDRPGIVARVTGALYEGGCNLGEATMARLGNSFAMMVMVQHPSAQELAALVRPAADAMGLRVNVEPVAGEREARAVPDVSITVHGADRAGIVAQVTGALAEAGLNILDLRSDVAGSPDRPIYVMHIEGKALEGIDPLRQALERTPVQDVEVTIEPIDTLFG
jgi:glycine cleavage system transcriptional repressor